MRKIEFAILVIIVVFFAQLLFFYRDMYIPPHVNEPDFLNISVNISKPIEINDSFIRSNGTVLIDLSHGNNFNARDMNLLFSRIIARGYTIEYLGNGSDMNTNLSDSNSFVVISPASSFSSDEVKSVKDFVNRGGRVLMLSEPINDGEINSLASEFGILFWNDYLYNLKENDGNFKYIYLTEFQVNNITRGLHRIAFYTSGSVFGNGIIFTDNNTYSSSSGEKRRYSVAVMTNDSQVLAIGDVAFLTEPYNVLDNNRLIYNLADFLSQSKPEEVNMTAINATNVSRAG